MSSMMALLVLVAILFVLLASGLEIAFALGLTGIFGLVVWQGGFNALSAVGEITWDVCTNFTLMSIPLFVLMSSILIESGISNGLYRAVAIWIRRVPGGLAVASEIACAIFAAVSGSSVATAAAIGRIAIPEMLDRGYQRRLTSGCIAAGGTLGLMIPPSTGFIIYGSLMETSIGQLFIAGIIPGLFLASAFILTIFVWAKLRPGAAPKPPQATWGEKFKSLSRVWTMLLLMALIMGGIWGGIFTPVEAGGIGAFGALIIGLIRRGMSWKKFVDSLLDTAKMSGMIFVLLIGVMMFNYFFIMTRVPEALANGIVSLSIPPVAIVIVMMICWLIGGCFLDTFGLMMLTLPVFIPIAKELGIDLIWFGILHVICIEAGAISPPVGVNVFMIAGMAKHIPMYTIFKGIVPFLIAMLIVLGVLIAAPDIVTFLPNLMR